MGVNNSLFANPYKVYTALLTQSGENPPVATILENTLGFDVTWLYSGVGTYDIDTSIIFNINKTSLICTCQFGVVNVTTFGPGWAGIRTKTYNGDLVDGDIISSYLKNNYFEIRVYN